MKKINQENGFSLVEVLVAILILGMITATIWVTLGNSVEIQGETRSIDERNHEIRSTLERMAKEISMAFISRNQSIDKRTQTIFLGSNLADRDRLDFTSLSHLKMRTDAHESDQNEVSYYMEKEDDTFNLYRREDPIIDRNPEEGGNRYILMEDVTAFDLRYWDGRRNKWRDDWDTSSRAFSDRLPFMVEITIKYKNHRDQERFLRTTTPLHMVNILE